MDKECISGQMEMFMLVSSKTDSKKVGESLHLEEAQNSIEIGMKENFKMINFMG